VEFRRGLKNSSPGAAGDRDAERRGGGGSVRARGAGGPPPPPSPSRGGAKR
jgi:hypothetical protein